MNTMMKIGVALLIIAVTSVAVMYGDKTTTTVIASIVAALAAMVITILTFFLISPLLKERLLHDAANKEKIGMFVKVGNGRSVAIDFGGNFSYDIDGDKNGFVESNVGVWNMYKRYIWNTTGYHVYVPYFTEPKTYDLPRYDVKEKDGKRIYVVVKEDDPRYRSNHVRTAPFTWNFEFAGADIQTVPYTVKGSAQVVIDKSKVKEALYMTESWNVLLDQALNSVTRSVVRSKVNIDMVIGAVEKELWSDPNSESGVPMSVGVVVAELIHDGIMEYQFDDSVGGDFAGKKLSDLGINVLKIDITDFEDELTDPERVRIRASALGRQEGRSRDLTGQGIANEQAHMAAVLKELEPDLRQAILKNRAFVDAVTKGGSVESLITALTGKLVGTKE